MVHNNEERWLRRLEQTAVVLLVVGLLYLAVRIAVDVTLYRGGAL
jgi:hypothetical protein